MVQKKNTERGVSLYPGVTLRGGEVLLWDPDSLKKPIKKAAKKSPFTVSVDNPVDELKASTRFSRKDGF